MYVDGPVGAEAAKMVGGRGVSSQQEAPESRQANPPRQEGEREVGLRSGSALLHKPTACTMFPRFNSGLEDRQLWLVRDLLVARFL